MIASGVIAVTAGSQHTCALRSDGSIACWGYSDAGQVGSGSTGLHTTPVSVSGIASALMIDAGYTHTCALLSEGTVSCWGGNDRGQIGDGSYVTRRTTPATVVGLGNVRTMAVGSSHACALQEDGVVQCWGWGTAGQLGQARLPYGPHAGARAGAVGSGQA